MQFEQGRFDLPHFIHATDVPGTAVLTRLRDRISYKYDPTAGGGRVDIRTTDPEALGALHAFLRFQITDQVSPGLDLEGIARLVHCLELTARLAAGKLHGYQLDKRFVRPDGAVV